MRLLVVEDDVRTASWSTASNAPVAVTMPHPSGIEVCRHLRASGWTGGVVIVSVRGSPPDSTAAQRAGADAFLAKPFPLDDLLAAVESLARPNQRHVPE